MRSYKAIPGSKATIVQLRQYFIDTTDYGTIKLPLFGTVSICHGILRYLMIRSVYMVKVTPFTVANLRSLFKSIILLSWISRQ